jgi:hypothetical protein
MKKMGQNPVLFVDSTEVDLKIAFNTKMMAT